MRFLLIAFFSIGFTTSFCQISTDSVAKLLAGNQHKEWVAKPWVNVMGGDPVKKCDGGESYTFSKDGTVEIRRCVNGAIVKNNNHWNVSNNGHDNFLHIGDDKYQIRTKSGRHPEVKLRVLVGDKVTTSKEVILKYEKY